MQLTESGQVDNMLTNKWTDTSPSCSYKLQTQVVLTSRYAIASLESPSFILSSNLLSCRSHGNTVIGLYLMILLASLGC